MTTWTDPIEVTLCESCVFADAYGFPNEMDSEDTVDSLPLSTLGEGWLLGSLPCEHGMECGSCDSPSSEPYFSRGCDGCNTTLAGNRYDYLIVYRED